MGESQKKLSVLMLSPDPRVLGGVTTFAATVQQYLAGYEFTPLSNGSLEHNPESAFATLKRLLVTPLRLFRMVRAKHYDVVHINPSLTFKSTVRDCLLLLALRLAGYRRILFYIHGWDSNVAERLQREWLIRRPFAWLLNGTARITVLSPDFKDSLVRMGVKADKITLTKTMFDGKSIVKMDIPPSACGGRRNILFMSRFVVGKGVYQLLDAFASIAKDFPDLDLIMAGDGAEAASLKRKTAEYGLGERVIFTGYVGGEEKARLLNACDIYALPSKGTGEGMPIALLEAMAVGKPLLASDSGGVKYIISEPENGILLYDVTAESIEAGLRKMLADPKFCEECGKRNEAYAWKNFEAKQVTNEIGQVYQAIARQ